MTYRYSHIKTTKCGKCQNLKWLREAQRRNPEESYFCEANKEGLPDTVVSFFGDACTEFKEIAKIRKPKI